MEYKPDCVASKDPTSWPFERVKFTGRESAIKKAGQRNLEYQVLMVLQ
jgi:hypothetical protein